MANNEFKNVEEFIEGFTRIGHTPNDFKYDGIIFGIEFLYKNKYYRITRDRVGNEKELQKKFNKSEKAFIQLFEIPRDKYPVVEKIPSSNYIGIFDDVYDLLNNGIIDGVQIKNIIADQETEILAID